MTAKSVLSSRSRWLFSQVFSNLHVDTLLKRHKNVGPLRSSHVSGWNVLSECEQPVRLSKVKAYVTERDGSALEPHLLAAFFWLSMSSLRKRKPSCWAVCAGGWGTDGLLWAGADRDRLVSPPPLGSFGRGLRRGLGRSLARGLSGRDTFSGRPLGRRGISPRACGEQLGHILSTQIQYKWAVSLQVCMIK